MGSGISRTRSPWPRSLATFLCGGGGGSGAFLSSSAAASVPDPRTGDRQAEESVIAVGHHDSISADSLHMSFKNCPKTASENVASSSRNEHPRTCQSNNGRLNESATYSRKVEDGDIAKKFSETKEIIPCLTNASSDVELMNSRRSLDLASTSTKSEPFGPLLLNGNALAPTTDIDDSTSNFESQVPTTRLLSDIIPAEAGELSLNNSISSTNPTMEVLGVANFDANRAHASSGFSATSQLREETAQVPTPSGSATLTSNATGQQSDGSTLHVDVFSVSSHVLPSSAGEVSSSEARRNDRRIFWDTFSRSSARRISESTSLFSSLEDTDEIGFADRWMDDISNDPFDDGFDDDLIYLRRRRYGANLRRWHPRSEIRERLRGGLVDDSQRTTFCPSGLHPDGSCSCYSFLVTEESSTRASISRIVMLAEALFEVLDEIHRQPVLLSLSMVSIPAPEAVVNSLPVKSHQKLNTSGSIDDVEQCYICLAEYEDGDSIRVLPCCHEYHMSCVDKWLKEIHGVCPLCRGDVSGGGVC